MQRRRLGNLIRIALLGGVLIVVQAAAATHVDTADAHPAGEHCTLCVAVSTLGAANAGASYAISAELVHAPVATRRFVLPAGAPVSRYPIRGPPTAS